MDAEFNWWLLIVGLVVGAGLVWLVVLDSRRREADIDAAERGREALWLSAVLADDGIDVSPSTAGRMLELHRAYLDSPPPDDPQDPQVTPETRVPEADPVAWPVQREDAVAPSDDDSVPVSAVDPSAR